ncbi:hypothetical protein PaecuDRAFT_4600 [Paenibacillus curdlanolyticus YK9]|uniref:Uncharacterized protein n=1 Tax=Paenibacillus curdlanolyticus YK9 TaxID=717606 RepID=E0IG09_9BACL|nr:hypothetical protein [Paenibacillus curdlanolyticus]EFM08589.1 hypothetical protein PaecuDRAFT_4600 [Paenibacillus curdlanolyticus YK9]
MKNKLTITRFAMSAVLLSAVAFPAISNADSPNTSAKTAPLNVLTVKTETVAAPAGTVAATPAFAVTSFTDPTELAKKYAPDTVSDWKETIAQYEKLAGDKIIHGGIAVAAPALVPAPGADGKIITIQADDKGVMTVVEGKAGELPPLPVPPVGTATVTAPAKLVPAEAGKPSADGKATKVIIAQSVSGTGALPALPALPAGEAGKDTVKIANAPTAQLQGGISITQVGPLEEGKAIEIHAVSEMDESDMAFIKAEIALAEAVQADKPGDIKQALSELLKQYKVQIAELKTETAQKTTK